MKIIIPKDGEVPTEDKLTFFLAGSTNSQWRTELVERLHDLDVVVYDPYVENWDEEVGEEDINNEKWVNQTRWEHLTIISADHRIFYFRGGTLAPITLLEMGLYAKKGDLVYVADDYEKKAYIHYYMGRVQGLVVVESIKSLAEVMRIRFYTEDLHA